MSALEPWERRLIQRVARDLVRHRPALVYWVAPVLARRVLAGEASEILGLQLQDLTNELRDLTAPV
jgi:hypothetical protein